MEMKLYSVYDAKAGAYLTPFFFPNDAMAMRQMEMLLDGDGLYARHAEDFTLYEIGTFHDDTGTIDPREPVAVAGLGAMKAFMDSPGGQVFNEVKHG